jgi:hypothetical protein
MKGARVCVPIPVAENAVGDGAPPLGRFAFLDDEPVGVAARDPAPHHFRHRRRRHVGGGAHRRSDLLTFS